MPSSALLCGVHMARPDAVREGVIFFSGLKDLTMVLKESSSRLATVKSCIVGPGTKEDPRCVVAVKTISPQ